MLTGLTVTGINEVLDRLTGLEAAIRRNIVIELEWFGSTVSQIMITQHSFMNITGRLERSIGYTVEAWTEHSVSLLVFALAPYADLVETGTPTSRPYPYFWPVLYQYLPELMERLPKAVQEAFDEYGEVRRAG